MGATAVYGEPVRFPLEEDLEILRPDASPL
jgi:hypothetical protein